MVQKWHYIYRCGNRKIYICFQINLGTDKILETKLCFKCKTVLNGIKIKQYYSDNGVFINQKFINEIHKSEQYIIILEISFYY